MVDDQKDAAPSHEGADVQTLTISRRLAENVVLGVLLLTSCAAFVSSLGIRSFSDDIVGAQTFPLALSAMLALLCFVSIIAAQRLPADATIEIRRPRGVLVAVILLIVFPYLMQVLGYYVLIVPWLLAFGWAARVRGPLLIAINLATVIFIARVVFQMILGTPLP